MTSPHLIESVVVDDHLPAAHKVFATSLSAHDDPKTYNQAVEHAHWREAMKKGDRSLRSQ